jgi:hypothetical protein
MNYKMLFAGLVLLCACAAESPSPLACNTKAFTAEERADWRKRLEQVMSSVTAARDLPDGYALDIDQHKTSFLEVARWVELERKCCPFFVFELGMRGENGSIWLNLRGREGVKEFIAADLHVLFEHLKAISPGQSTK